MSSRWELARGAELAPGRIVVELIRTGKRYEVYLVWDERRYTLAVAKVLRRDRLENERSRAKLRAEAELLARLAHPGIVRSFDADLEGPRPHVLLEHIEAPSLRTLVRRHGALPPDQVVPLGSQAAAALHYIEHENVVHLDVKPSNVLLATPARLIDLGAARTVTAARTIERPVGTDLYMAPEICRVPETAARIGPAVDVWGLGATLYYGLTGRPPFAREPAARESGDPLVRFPQLTSAPDPLDRRVPRGLAELVLQLLDADPAGRPSAAEAADALGELQD